MAVPERTVDKDGNALFSKDDIGLPREVLSLRPPATDAGGA